MMRENLFVILLLLVATATLLQAATLTEQTNTTEQNDKQQSELAARVGRIMRFLKDPAPVKRNRAPTPPSILQQRRDRYPSNQQRPLPIVYHRPLHGGTRNQMLRRVQNGPPPNTLMRPQSVKGTRYIQNPKDVLAPPNFGKDAAFRMPFTKRPHPNALNSQGHSQQYLQNFKPSPQYSGNAIVRPVPDFLQYTNQKTEKLPFQEIKQYPLPQKHPNHQPQFVNQHSNLNTSPQTFPSTQQQQQQQKQKSHTQYSEALLNLSENAATDESPTYSVYEDPEISEHAPLQYNSQQNPLTYNPEIPMTQQLLTSTSKDAENYLKFMSTNEYFLPKFIPNYKKLDEEKDLRYYKQLKKQQESQQSQQHQLLEYGKTLSTADATGAATFQEPIQVKQLFNQGDRSSSLNTVLHGSYQTNNNAFVVKSDGNKAIKHIVPNSLAIQNKKTPTHARFNSFSQQTPEPIRFEFTEKDAVIGAHTNSPPPLNGNYHYQYVRHEPISSAPMSASGTNHNPSIAVNEVDADPEDGDDMHDESSDLYGRIPFRSSNETSLNNGIKSSTPSSQQSDTEEFCERMCANVQDEDAEIICGSDGYMYTGEAQMECYASCLHIDVTIKGKGSCSAR